MNINQWASEIVAGQAAAEAKQLEATALAGVLSSIKSVLGIAAVTTVTSLVTKTLSGTPSSSGGIH